MITTVDYHTGGEPFRIVTGGVAEIPGADVAARRVTAMTGFDDVRRLLCHEPRGHADMYGCFLVPPDDPGAHLGALFWHKDGFSTACGHGTIALGAYAVHEGLVEADPDGVADVVVDVPSGRVTAQVRMSAGRITSVTFVNVPSFVVARDVRVAGVKVDVAYGGAIYASVPAAAFGLSVEPRHLGALVEHSRRIKAELADHPAARHRSDERLSGVYGVIFHEGPPAVEGVTRQRNVTVFADGEVDRSPCGSGTAARMALLHDESGLGELVHEGIAGGVFTARVRDKTDEGVIVAIDGMAYRTGRHVFEVDPGDPFPTGFTLR
ncbi:proline racemase/trans-L-3-hydroxyproline dehydratase [Nonomuraea solani]|uniref:Proline racemase/trans-L-3-hydroxyproline dehydratase n=1 Tax=Nonomuraea solani TaxID=1144553 RepID=A0A1H6EUA7_9ACTN|nr:proline racemase family protein [Nonomuraea solani]SEH00636.1 proline racemase/trans-L-3-hydroxyproline dehydratase [Nonomuraea solani]